MVGHQPVFIKNIRLLSAESVNVIADLFLNCHLLFINNKRVSDWFSKAKDNQISVALEVVKH